MLTQDHLAVPTSAMLAKMAALAYLTAMGPWLASCPTAFEISTFIAQTWQAVFFQYCKSESARAQ